ncbi:MAG: hypothetical protein APG12_01674 [Candidatus Methanofastidiosum methylothiophilum]|uniref:Uncharacterized protein n=1 Tax=Candidatus Methanofastidiosum methylothiophilum TaxID=1705564 RepID=A0A150II26_9EURY|nr:MAG: hypothetical protein APG10_01646 [Candidatus Methanofastidiosum methylthiophilus]KYC46625.1 MAG: hypothetical protein APG11_01774 [Candidatus Methanofastidiosum methylthiophilus]KYC49113.1 MAG: hypothetical protein APG12_01674 [Candidatus Methanofastidiosum methylthiophilus]
MKKIYLVFLLTLILLFSNLIVVFSLTKEQNNQVAKDLYKTGATFMKAENFLKAKDFFIYSHNEAVKAGNNYLAYTCNERIKDCNNMLGLDSNDYSLSNNLVSKQIVLPSNITNYFNIKKTMTVSQYKKYDFIRLEAFKGQSLEFKYQIISGNVSIYFVDKETYDRFLRNNWFLTFSAEGITGIQLPSNTGPLVRTTYNVPESGYWYFMVITESAENGKVEIEIL